MMTTSTTTTTAAAASTATAATVAAAVFFFFYHTTSVYFRSIQCIESSWYVFLFITAIITLIFFLGPLNVSKRQ